MTNIERLTELQNKIGYIQGEVHPVAMLGLMGEVGEMAKEVSFVPAPGVTDCYEVSDIKVIDHMVGRFVELAEGIDTAKKMKRRDHIQTISIKVESDNFDAELSDLFYYLNAVAIGRGLTIDDLARMGYGKVIARRGVVNEGDPAR